MIENEVINEQPATDGAQEVPATDNPPVQAAPEPTIEPDPLTTPDIVMDEEEKRWRANPSEYFRLNRCHKPAATPERIAELEARYEEVKSLFEQLDALRNASPKDESKIKETETLIQRRMVKSYDQVVMRMYKANGLLTDKDREKIRAAEAKRAKRAERNVRLWRRDVLATALNEGASFGPLVEALDGHFDDVMGMRLLDAASGIYPSRSAAMRDEGLDEQA